MSLQEVKFSRGTTAELNDIPNDNRHILCNTETGEVSFETDGKRISRFINVKVSMSPAKNGNSVTISYPEDLNKNNCICLGVFSNYNYEEDNPDGYDWSNCILKQDGIEVTLGCDAGYYGNELEVNIVLMRV